MNAIQTATPGPRDWRSSPCRFASGGHLQKNGYVRWWLGPRHEYAHRAVLEVKLGRPILPGMVVDHRCGMKRCINPLHLEEVTPAENSRRWSLSLTHCPNGHEYTPENELSGVPGRRCKACHDAAIWRRIERIRHERS